MRIWIFFIFSPVVFQIQVDRRSMVRYSDDREALRIGRAILPTCVVDVLLLFDVVIFVVVILILIILTPPTCW